MKLFLKMKNKDMPADSNILQDWSLIVKFNNFYSIQKLCKLKICDLIRSHYCKALKGEIVIKISKKINYEKNIF